MDDLTFAMDLAINAEQPRTHDDAAVFLEHSRPDDQIGDACLVLDGDEHDAFRRSRPLTDEDEPGEPDIAAIANSIERVAGNHLAGGKLAPQRSEEHTSELQSLMRISYAVFCLKKKN